MLCQNQTKLCFTSTNPVEHRKNTEPFPSSSEPSSSDLVSDTIVDDFKAPDSGCPVSSSITDLADYSQETNSELLSINEIDSNEQQPEIRNIDCDTDTVRIQKDIDELNSSNQHANEENIPCEVIDIDPDTVCSKEKVSDFGESATVHPTLIDIDMPLRPILSHYKPTKFSTETFVRDFQPKWFETYPWLGYSAVKEAAYCYACEKYGNREMTFTNWKRTEKFLKHSKSDDHKTAMVKWMCHRSQAKAESSVMKLMDKNHENFIANNRRYLKIIIECLMYTAQQNIPQRGHIECRSDLANRSDENRGNFLEMLHIRSLDNPWLREMLVKKLGDHSQWTSPDMQNELLGIIADFVRERILRNIRESDVFAVIMDETSDISKDEQVSLCVSYSFLGERKETFIGFFSTKSTTGEALYELLCKELKELNLDVSRIVAECFDGASNMREKNKGLSSRMKETSPMSIYIHCYGHIINLAIQKTLEDIPEMRNTLGAVQSLYNFLEASPKRHHFFKDFDDKGNEIKRTLKSQSETRWACHWVAVKAVYEQLRRIVGSLLELSKSKDSKTYNDSKNLLKSMLDFKFIFGLVILRSILMNTSSLNSYLQGRKMDVVTIKRNAEMTIETLKNCRTERDHALTWDLSMKLSKDIDELVKEEVDFEFQYPKLTKKTTSKRFQALVGENVDSEDASLKPFDDFRVNVFYPSFDLVVIELESRFSENNLKLLCALSHVVMDEEPDDADYNIVSQHYSIDKGMLIVEHNLFYSFKRKNSESTESPGEILSCLHRNDQLSFLPHYGKVVQILAIIPVTSCSAERSFSTLRRLKNYLRSTMNQSRLSSLALLSIERIYGNEIMDNDIDKIIDKFGERKGRNKYFF